MQPSGAGTNPYEPPQADISGDQLGDHISGESGGPRDVYLGAIKFALAQQVIVLLLTALLLDGGRAFRGCTIAALASWGATFLIMLRRPRSPTRVDLAWVRHGFWLLLILTWVAIPIVRKVTGQA